MLSVIIHIMVPSSKHSFSDFFSYVFMILGKSVAMFCTPNFSSLVCNILFLLYLLCRTLAMSVSSFAVQDWLRRQKDSVKPWSDFLNTKKFTLPKSVAPVGPRLIKNIERFQSNYVFIFLGLAAVCM